MFEAIYEDAVLIRKIFGIVGRIISECRIIVDDRGIFLGGVDDSRVAAIRCHIPSDIFYKFSFDSDDDKIEIGTDLKFIMRILGRITGKDSIRLALEDDIFTITIFRGTLDNMQQPKKYYVPSLPLDYVDLPPNFGGFREQDVIAETYFPNLFYDLISCARIMDEYVNIIGRDDKIIITAEGPKGKFEGYLEEEDLCALVINQETATTYDASYIAKILTPIAEGLTLSFANKMPLYLKQDLTKIEVEAIIAPISTQ